MTSDAPRAGAAEWTPERPVSAAQAADEIARQFPQLRGAPVRPLASGWDNAVHVVDGRWAFRFPHRAVAVPGVRREIAVLPRLAPRLPLPIPVPVLVGVPSPTYPWPFYGARLLAGTELAEARPPGRARRDAAAAVGAFLAALHHPDTLAAVAEPPTAAPPTAELLPVDPLHRGEPAVRGPRTRERLARIARRGVWTPDPAVDRLLTEAERLGPPTGAPVVVHGDLHIRHLLVDGGGRATGVIDWGDLCRADPAVDLCLAYAAFTGTARAALLSAYGPVGAERELRARALAVFLSAALADYAASEARPGLLGEALAGLRRAVTD